MIGIGLPGRGVGSKICRTCATKRWIIRENDRQFILVEVAGVLQARPIIEGVPAVFFLDDRNAAQRARGIIPAEGEIDLLPVVQGAHFHNRFARSVQIGALVREDKDRTRARPRRIAHGTVELGRVAHPRDEERVARRPIKRGDAARDRRAYCSGDEKRPGAHCLRDHERRRPKQPENLGPAAIQIMRSNMREDVGKADEGGRGVQIAPPAAAAEIHHDARPREEDHECVDKPVQDDVDGSPFEASGSAHCKESRLLEADAFGEFATGEVDNVGRPAEESGESGKEVPGKDLALRQDRSEPLREWGMQRVRCDAYAGKETYEERKRACPMQRYRPDIGARQALLSFWVFLGQGIGVRSSGGIVHSLDSLTVTGKAIIPGPSDEKLSIETSFPPADKGIGVAQAERPAEGLCSTATFRSGAHAAAPQILPRSGRS